MTTREEVLARVMELAQGDLGATMEAARDGTLTVPPDRARAAAEADRMAMEQMTRQGPFDRAGELAAGLTAGAVRGLGDIGAGSRATVEGSMDPNGRVQAGPITPVDGRAAISDATRGMSDFRAEGTAGDYAATIGEFLPWTVGMGGAGMLKYGAAPAIASETAGQATEGTAMEPWARAGAAIATPAALGGANALIRKLISPHGGVDPKRLEMVRQLEESGVPVTSGQKTGAERLRYTEANSPRMAETFDRQKEAFSRAAMRQVGVDDIATPEAMTAANRQIGSVFDDVTRGVDLPARPRDAFTASRAVREGQELSPTGQIAPAFRNIADQVKAAVTGGNPITGQQYQSWRSKLSKLTTSPDAATRDTAIDMVNLLDDTMGRGLSAAGRPQDAARLSGARSQYRDFLALERAASSPSANTGTLSPAAIRQAVSTQGRRAYTQGQRPLGELARAGDTIMKPLPQSGTQPRMAAEVARQLGPLASGAGVGAAIGGAIAGPVGAGIGGGIGLTVPAARNAFMASRLGQGYLGNQRMAPAQSLGVMDARTAATAGAAANIEDDSIARRRALIARLLSQIPAQE